jgi:hypothetical protein
LFLGGTNSRVNMCITHPDCNMEKGAKVTMSYKESCKRRQYFNSLRLGRKVHEKILTNPQYKLTKKQSNNLKKYLKSNANQFV